MALEFGSSKIRGVAGCKNVDGSVRVLDVEQIDARHWIHKGAVRNIDKTVMGLKSIIEKMDTAVDARILTVFVGIGGQSVRTRKNTVSRQFATKTIVSQELVDALQKNNRNTVYAGYEILDVIPQEYHVGLDTTIDPVGVLCSQIEGTYLNVVAKTELKEYILKCLDACGLKVAGIFVSPVALADCILTDTEKRSGCALVDFGYGTTTVAVYKNNLLRHLAVIPLGGNNITQDICSLQIEEDEAENLKVKYGSAYSDLSKEELAKNLLVNNGRTIEERSLVDIVEAREEEILGNVAAQIHMSGFQDKLISGVVASGAAANIKNIEQAISIRLHPEKIRLVRIVPLALQSVNDEQVTKDGSLNVLLALLNEGNQNCTEPKVEIKQPEPEPEIDLLQKSEWETETVEPVRQSKVETENASGTKHGAREEKKSKSGFGAKIKDWLKKATDIVTEE
ncbi:MAG: cell division protein FtsA [Paraprevotella sp.]|nr:cell division protein FtsA [Paraprevotella sp.]